MATFRAAKGFHFGCPRWALFEPVPGSDPAVFGFETDDAKVIARLEDVDGVTRLDTPARRGRPPKVATTEPAGAV